MPFLRFTADNHEWGFEVEPGFRGLRLNRGSFRQLAIPWYCATDCQMKNRGTSLMQLS
jgi:hypothetical protein